MKTPKKPPASGSGVHVTVDNLEQLKADLLLLADSEVLVGFPESSTERQDGSTLTNAARGYIHDNGAPEVNIPARPFMVPGIEAARMEITASLGRTALSVVKNATKANPSHNIVERGLHAAGLTAVSSIKQKITEGVPPPLADSTLRARAARVPSRKAEKKELENRAAGMPPSTELVKPLIDTGEMINAVKHVIRSKKDRS